MVQIDDPMIRTSGHDPDPGQRPENDPDVRTVSGNDPDHHSLNDPDVRTVSGP